MPAYIQAVNNAFYDRPVDFAQLIKIYGPGGGELERRYSPAECVGTRKQVVFGEPNEKFISTSYVERSNLTLRMKNRRLTRLTNAFSKKFINHVHSLSLHFFVYNFITIHGSLRVTPAMQAGLTKKPMTFEDIVKLIDYN